MRNISQQLVVYQHRITEVVLRFVGNAEPASLKQALIYALSGDGKRMRPSFIYAVGDFFDANNTLLDYVASAVEMVHTYSLIHDDLPSMDDDDLRRGRPTLHVAFNEATAILTGDALQALAYEVLCQAPTEAHVKCCLIAELARASGTRGMVTGQFMDIHCAGQDVLLDLEALKKLHAAKTGELIKASVLMAGIVSGATDSQLADLGNFANNLGLAYQVHDDILDVESDTETLRKTANKDVEQDKNTFCRLMGVAKSKAYRDCLIDEAHQHIAWIDDGHILHQLTDYVAARVY